MDESSYADTQARSVFCSPDWQCWLVGAVALGWTYFTACTENGM